MQKLAVRPGVDPVGVHLAVVAVVERQCAEPVDLASVAAAEPGCQCEELGLVVADHPAAAARSGRLCVADFEEHPVASVVPSTLVVHFPGCCHRPYRGPLLADRYRRRCRVRLN